MGFLNEILQDLRRSPSVTQTVVTVLHHVPVIDVLMSRAVVTQLFSVLDIYLITFLPRQLSSETVCQSEGKNVKFTINNRRVLSLLPKKRVCHNAFRSVLFSFIVSLKDGKRSTTATTTKNNNNNKK